MILPSIRSALEGRAETKAAFPSWPAHLHLAYQQVNGQTTPTRRLSSGPLRLQKSFWPEGPRSCHQILVHPPGGIAGNDQLHIELQLQAGSQVLLTTPGAAKWYASLGPMASQQLRAELGPNSRLEWLPQENIFFAGCQATLESDWILSPGSQLLTAEMLCFGRPANAELFSHGFVRQHNRYWLGGAGSAEQPSHNAVGWGKPVGAQQLLFQERFQLRGNSAALQAQAAMGAHPCLGTLVATAPNSASTSWSSQLRDTLSACTPDSEWAATSVAGLTILRWRGRWAEEGWGILRQAWQIWREQQSGQAAPAIRIWST